MKRTYLEGMLADLISRSAHPGVKSVTPWHGPTPTEKPAGLHVQFTNGAALYTKIVGLSGPGGGHSQGPDEFEPAALADADVAGIGGHAPVRVSEFAQFLRDLIGRSGHPEVVDVSGPRPGGQGALRVTLADGHRIILMFVRAVAPGGRSASPKDYEIAEVMA